MGAHELMAFESTCGVIFVKCDGDRYELSYESRTDVVQLGRRTMAQALRELADAFDAQADLVGD